MSTIKIMNSAGIYSRYTIVALICTLFLAGATDGTLQAQSSKRVSLEENISATLEFDWQAGTVRLDLRCSLDNRQRLSPALRRRCLDRIERLLPRALIETLSSRPITSDTTFGSRFSEDPPFTGHLAETARKATRSSTFFSQNVSRFQAMYRIPLYPDIVEPLIGHNKARTPPPLLEYTPTGNYSGIVIYVEEKPPLFGTNRQTQLTPALFPRILGPDLEPVIERNMVEPETLTQRGMVAFFDHAQIHQVSSRVGEVPFHTSAEAIFGVQRTDIVVSARAARRLRASEHMYSLIREGKIAIVAPLSQ